MERTQHNDLRPCGIPTDPRCWRVAAVTEILANRPGHDQADVLKVAAQTPLPPPCAETCWRHIGSFIDGT